MTSIESMKKFLLPVFCVLLLIGCDQFLPGAYQQKDFPLSDLDAKACEYLSGSLGDSVSTSALTNFDSTWVGSAIYDNVEEILDSLEAHDMMITYSDTSFTIITPEEVDSNYVSLSIAANTFVFYFSDFVDMNIITADAVIEAESKDIPLETIYYGVSPDTVYDEVVTDSIVDIIDCSKLKARIVYTLSESTYLMQITKSDMTSSSTFRLVILPAGKESL